MGDKPAVLGSKPLFDELLPMLKPTLPKLDDLLLPLREIFDSGQITTGRFVKEFEKKISEYLGVKHCITVSSCTDGLMLVEKCLGLSGEVIVPSFTFSATGMSLLWSGLKPVFIDCFEDTFNIDTDKIEDFITPRTSAILAVHIFGNPVDIEGIVRIASKYNLKIIFDAAHAFGSTCFGKKVGCFGDAEVFSLSPTKLLTAGEGGLVTTNDDKLARNIIIGRNYGDPGNYDCEFAGLSSRMTEWSAIVGMNSLDLLEDNIRRRNHIADLYRKRLMKLPGLREQTILNGNRSTYKDFSVIVDRDKFGLNRDTLQAALEKEGIQTRKYFYPPLHKMKAFQGSVDSANSGLIVTEQISNNVISLPIYAGLDDEEVKKIIIAIESIHDAADEIRSLSVKNNV